MLQGCGVLRGQLSIPHIHFTGGETEVRERTWLAGVRELRGDPAGTLTSQGPLWERPDQAFLDARNLEEKRLLWKLPDVSEAGGKLWLCMKNHRGFWMGGACLKWGRIGDVLGRSVEREESFNKRALAELRERKSGGSHSRYKGPAAELFCNLHMTPKEPKENGTGSQEEVRKRQIGATDQRAWEAPGSQWD